MQVSFNTILFQGTSFPWFLCRVYILNISKCQRDTTFFLFFNNFDDNGDSLVILVFVIVNNFSPSVIKNEIKIFLVYKEISDGIGCKIIYEEGRPHI
jgi:hypothetical protein